MRKVRYIRDLRRLLAAAIWDHAEQTSPTSWRWNCAGQCEDPQHFTMEGRHPEWAYQDDWGDLKALDPRTGAKVAPMATDNTTATLLWIDMTVRCRRCRWCLRKRANLWSHRARAEIQTASRTWFGTLTLRPDEHWRTSCAAQVALRARGTKWAELSPVEQFQARHSVISGEITKWLKRIRKESGSRLRYCLVAEAHRSGLPHYHVLIHERSIHDHVGERTLRRQWKLGHSKFNLVNDAGAAWYVAKYLAKASEARVRASARYGHDAL